MNDTDASSYCDYTSSHTLSIRSRVFHSLDKNHELLPKQLCKLLDLDYKLHGGYVRHLRGAWKCDYKNRQALKCLSFHNVRGWIYALKLMDRGGAVGKGWLLTRARNRMLLWKGVFGRVEWHETGRVNVWIRKPATAGRAKQLLADAFFATGLIDDVQVFDLWANSLRFKGSHVVYDVGERLPYAKVEYLKDALSVVVKMGDVTHPTGLEIEFAYPNWAERNELLLQQASKALELNNQQIQQFNEFLKEWSQPKQSKNSLGMVI